MLQTVSEKTSLSSEFLEDSLHTEAVEGQDFMKIIARHDDRKKAVIIANLAAETYVAHRKEAKQEAFAALDDELNRQRQLIQSHQGTERQEAQDLLAQMILNQREVREDLKSPQTPVIIYQFAE